MSTVDFVVIGLVGLTALSGFRRGLVVGVLSLAGLALGGYLGARLGPSVFSSERARWFPFVAVGSALVGAMLGQAIGVVIGRNVRRGLFVLGPLKFLDNIGGLVLGAATGIALSWAVGAVMLYVPGQTKLRRYAQESRILNELNNEFPPHRLIDALAHIDPFATLAGPAAGVDPPDPAVLDSKGVNGAALSVVRVIGTACGLGVEGSGWVAGRGIVVTNAHVVAGVLKPRVDRNDGRLLSASVVAFDRTNDVAVLRVPGLTANPLPLTDPVEGTAAGMLGYPENGPYTETAARIGRTVSIVTRDAYGDFPVTRRVTTIRGVLRSGNSGGPLVDAAGRVITMAFAQRVGSDGGYGVPTDLIRDVLDRAGTKPVSSACVGR